MERADVVVIGSGFAGAATAWWLRRSGVDRVVLLEREGMAGAHATGKNAGIARQATADAYITFLAARSVSFIRNPPQGFSETPLFFPSGGFITSVLPEDPRLELFRKNAMAAGVYTYLADRLEALERVPALQNAPFKTLLACPLDGTVDIHGYLTALLENVHVLTDTEVTGFKTTAKRVRSVETTRGSVTADWFVNAAGAWAGLVGEMAGALPISITPRRRHLLHTGPVAWADPAGPYIWSLEPEVYFRPESGGFLLSPCDAQPMPPGTPPADPDSALWLAQRLSKAFPKLASLPVARSWAELRSFSPDEGFVIGKDPRLGNLVWVAGLGGHGMTTACAVGELAAALVTGAVPYVDPEPFSPRRFA
jgi:D-arginine dehydrogenase